MDTFEFEFEGNKFEADKHAASSWRIMRAIVCGDIRMFDAIDEMFCGRADEYSDIVGGSVEKMGELAARAVEVANAKNS